MANVSAFGALGPAFAHTRSMLAARPLRVGRVLKLALVAALTQSTFLSVALLYPLQGAQLGLARPWAGNNFAGSPALAAVGVGLAILALIVILAFTLAVIYLVCRLRVTLFGLVVAQGRVRDAWRRYPGANSRYFRLFLVATVAWWAVLLATLSPFLIVFIRQVLAATKNGAGIGFTFAGGSQLVTIALLSWLLLPIWLAIDAALQDFLLPILALEPEAGWPDVFAQFGGFVRRQPGQVLLFLVVRTIVPAVVGLAAIIAEVAALALLALAGYGVGKLLWRTLGEGSLAAHAAFYAAAAGIVLFLAVLHTLGILVIYGFTGTLKTSYAALFFAGDYPGLASALRPGEQPEVGPSGTEFPSTPIGSPGLW